MIFKQQDLIYIYLP